MQRVLGAKNAFHAKMGTVLCGLMKILPMFLIVLPGMVARTLFPKRVGCASACECEAVCGNADGCSNIAYPELVLNVLPTGLTGLLLAVMMAALMSSLASTFNSAGTMFTMDVWNALRPRSSQRQQVIVGYVVVAAMVGISVAWLPVLEALQGDQLFLYLQVSRCFKTASLFYFRVRRFGYEVANIYCSVSNVFKYIFCHIVFSFCMSAC